MAMISFDEENVLVDGGTSDVHKGSNVVEVTRITFDAEGID